MMFILQYLQRSIKFIGFLLLTLVFSSCVGEESLNISKGGVISLNAYIEISKSFVGVGESITVTLKSNGDSLKTIVVDDVEFSLSGGTSDGTFGTVTKNSNGTFSSTFTGTTVGSATYIQFNIEGKDIEARSAPSIRVTPGNLSTSFSTISLDNATPAAGDTVTITLTAYTSSGSAMTQGGLLASCTATVDSVSTPTTNVIDNSNGTYTSTFVARTAFIAGEVSCKLNESSISDTAAFTATAGPAVHITIVSGNSQVAAVTSALAPFIVKITDTYDNVVENETVDWSITTWTGTGSAGTLGAATSDSDASGLAQVIHTFDTTVGSVYISAAISGSPTIQTLFTAVAIPDVASSIEIVSGNTQTSPINTPFTEALTVLIKDAYGNTVENETITWTLKTGTGTITFSELTGITLSNSSGVASIAIDSYSIIESFVVEARLNVSTAVDFDTLETVYGDPATIEVVEGDNQTAQTMTALATNFKAIVKDVDGNPVPNSAVTWTISDVGGSFPTAADALSDIDGFVSAPYKNGTAPGIYQVAVTSQVDSAATVSFTVTSTEGPATSLVLVSGNSQNVVLGKTSDSLIVQLLDDQGIPLQNKSIQWTVLDAGHTIVDYDSIITDSDGKSSVQILVSDDTAGTVDVMAELVGSAVPSYTFTINAIYHPRATAYFDRIDPATPVLTDANKKLINDFARGLDDLEITGGADPAAEEIWLMRSQFNKGTGSTVYGFLGKSNMTLEGYTAAQWTDEVADPTKFGICFLNDDQYGTTTTTKKALYSSRSILGIVQRIGNLANESYMQSSELSFDESIDFPGMGFKIGKSTAGWGDDYGNVWLDNVDGGFTNVPTSIPLSLPPTAIQSQFDNGTASVFLNGSNKVTGSVGIDTLGDSYSISFARRDRLTGSGARGLDGCMPFAMHMNQALSDTQVADLYTLIKNTVGSGMSLP